MSKTFEGFNHAAWTEITIPCKTSAIYWSPYQHGGTIFTPRNPWAVTSYQPYGVDPMILRSVRQRAKQKGGKLHTVTYPWMIKGRKPIKRRRK